MTDERCLMSILRCQGNLVIPRPQVADREPVVVVAQSIQTLVNTGQRIRISLRDQVQGPVIDATTRTPVSFLDYNQVGGKSTLCWLNNALLELLIDMFINDGALSNGHFP